MSEILDLIDNALSDVATGKDAMRWTPDASTTAPTCPTVRIVYDPAVLQAGLVEANAAITKFARALSAAGWSFAGLCKRHADEQARDWRAKRARLRRMHTAYRRSWKR